VGKKFSYPQKMGQVFSKKCNTYDRFAITERNFFPAYLPVIHLIHIRQLDFSQKCKLSDDIRLLPVVGTSYAMKFNYVLHFLKEPNKYIKAYGCL